jgi:hypothetical protein
MRNKRFLLGLLVMVLAFGMTFVGCDNGSGGGGSDGGGTVFDGTWTGDDDQGNGMELVAAGGSLTVSMDGSPAFRGTYTVNGNNVAVTFTEMNTGSGWTAFPENGGGDLPPKNITGTITGNSVNFEGMEFTKKIGGGTP